MTEKQMQRFIKKVYGGSIHIRYFSKEHKYGTCQAFVDGNVISLNTDYTNSYSDVVLQGILLHEIGHLVTENHKNLSVEEYRAQVWAIKKAKKLGMKKVVANLEDQFRKWDKTGMWKHGFYELNGWRHCREYILASRLAKKNGII